MSGSIEHQVLWLQVTMNYIKMMQMLNCQDYFCQIGSCPILLQIDLFIQQLPQIPTRQILKDEEVARSLAEREWRFDQMFPCYFLEDGMLLLDGLKTVLDIALWHFNDLQGIDVPCFFPSHHVNLPKGPFSKHLQKLKT